MSAPPRIDAVILAAGRSTRMEQPKPLLEVGGQTFIERTIDLLRGGGCRTVVAVVRATDEDVRQRAEAAGATVVTNGAPESEQIDSLRLGLGALPADWECVAVLPVDVPLLNDDTVAALVAGYAEHRAPITLPFHNGVAGHPVLLGRQIEAEIVGTEWEEGIRSLIMAHARDLREVKVVDPGILIDIDSQEDYWRYVQEKNR